MTGAQQCAELQRRIWQIGNEVPSAVDAWDFKQYVLGTLFYRFISVTVYAFFSSRFELVSQPVGQTASSMPCKEEKCRVTH